MTSTMKEFLENALSEATVPPKKYKKSQVKKWNKILAEGIQGITNVIANVPMTQHERESELKSARLFMFELKDRIEKNTE